MRRKIYTLKFLMSQIRPSFSAKYSMHEMDTHAYKTYRSKHKHYVKSLASGLQNN